MTDKFDTPAFLDYVPSWEGSKNVMETKQPPRAHKREERLNLFFYVYRVMAIVNKQ
jgi:hypothetical protein